jgi:RNA polymerase sigma-70 factor (ECF subfamily)
MIPTVSPAHLDDQPYEEHIRLIRQRILDFAAAKIGRESAEDIAQDCLMILVQKYPHVRDLTSMIKIAVTVARNKMFEHFRHAKREAELLDTTPDQTDVYRELERRQVVSQILVAMLRLDDKCRKLLMLKLEEKGSTDIQKLMGANSINTIYTWERRCLKKLMEVVGGTLYVRTDR